MNKHSRKHALFPSIEAWRKLPKIEESQALAQRIAPGYMADIIGAVESQLQSLEKQFRRSNENLPTTDEYFELRYGIFVEALRTFSESFTSHRLFLRAIDDEQQKYVQFLHKRIEKQARELEQLRGQLSEHQRGAEDVARKRKTLVDEYELKLSQLQAQFDDFRTHQLEIVVRERAAAPDLKRQIQELELQRQLNLEEIRSLRTENANLLRLNEALVVDTFSDSLQATRLELHTLKEVNASREEQILELNDGVEDLSRDLRRLADAFAACIGRQLSSSDLRFTRRGHVLLFGDNE